MVTEAACDVVGFVQVEMPLLPPPATNGVAKSPRPAESIDIDFAGGRRLKVSSWLATAELRRLSGALESV